MCALANAVIEVLATSLANIDIAVQVDLVHVLFPFEHFEAQLNKARVTVLHNLNTIQ